MTFTEPFEGFGKKPIFLRGYHQDFFEKKVFCQAYTNYMPVDAVRDADYESAIIFAENIYMKHKKRKIRVHFGM